MEYDTTAEVNITLLFYRLNNYTKFSSFVVLHLKSTGRTQSFLMQQCLNLSILMKVLLGRDVRNFQPHRSTFCKLFFQ